MSALTGGSPTLAFDQTWYGYRWWIEPTYEFTEERHSLTYGGMIRRAQRRFYPAPPPTTVRLSASEVQQEINRLDLENWFHG